MSALIHEQGQTRPSTDSTTIRTNSSGIQTSALINLMDKIKLQPIDISQLKITALDTANLVNTASFDIRL